MVNEAYFSLLLSDSYLPGCLALAQALRASGTSRPLVLLALDHGLSDHTMDAVKSAFNLVLRVPAVYNPAPRNLQALGRPDLILTFTKILLWNQTAFDRIVYLDADVLPLANIDSLFLAAGSLAACPDAGWPDIFNSGVMVLSPSSKDFEGLYALAETGETFDGGDQGLLNEYFGSEWTRLPFLYNVTPSTGYEYLPSFARFSPDVKAVHFIGLPKPWQRDRPSSSPDFNVSTSAADLYNRLLSKWWSTLDSSPLTSLAKQPLATPPALEQTPELDVSLQVTSVLEPSLPELPEPPEPPEPLSFHHLTIWNPSESEPPMASGGEAVALPAFSYENSWDRPYDPRTDTVFIPPPIIHPYEYYLPPTPKVPPPPPPRESTPPRREPTPPSPPPAECHEPFHPPPELHHPTPVQAQMFPPPAYNEPYQEEYHHEEYHPQEEYHPPLQEYHSSHIDYHPPRMPSPPPPPLFPWEMREIPAPKRSFLEDIVPAPLEQIFSPLLSSPEPEVLIETDDTEDMLSSNMRDDDSVDVEGETEVSPEDSFSVTETIADRTDQAEVTDESKEDLGEELAEDEAEDLVLKRLESLEFSDTQQPEEPPRPSPIMASPTPRKVLATSSATAYNVWDRDPDIQLYVNQVSQAFFGGRQRSTSSLTGLLAPGNGFSPAPLRRSSFYRASSNTMEQEESDESEDDEPTYWDPFKKLEELASMPSLLLARQQQATAEAEQEES
ncbi:nucleotide-diphospho-sugar transferase [Lipomyces arxii]|uniref:nucleotide-diphospho-sugar transferase n=1 Tax=Lipomyces arxii TaxID=56418 RepID=UPI0034CD10AB